MADQEHSRRSEDRDRNLNGRLDQMERMYNDLTAKVTQLESSVQFVKLEQGHLKEIFDVRMRGIEKGQEIVLAEMKAIGARIETWATEPEKSVAGRMLKDNLHQISVTCEEHGESIERIRTWIGHADGVLLVFKWTGPLGVISLIIWIIKLLISLKPGG